MICTLLVLGGLLLDKPASLVDPLHKQYVELFEDLSLTERGQFGVTRVGSDQINAHSSKVKNLNDRDYEFNVSIFGNHGKPLDAKRLEFRYTRNVNYFAQRPGRHVPAPREVGTATKALAAKLVSKRATRVVAQNGDLYMEARPILLSKIECLSCHSGAKLGSMVAVMVYQFAPR
ncbi:MAG: hypothetical protein JSS66_03855 [Armatimonadetes bacterium]|nr:hypothetical protein [Armatimonadota bacterium]